MIIKHVTFEDAGPYVCIATQGSASVRSGVQLTVRKGIFLFNFVLFSLISFFIINDDFPIFGSPHWYRKYEDELWNQSFGPLESTYV